MDATPSVRLPSEADRSGVPAFPPAATTVGASTLRWGERTFVMGILNVTPDSFSGDGLLAESAGAIAERAIAMVAAGADMLDVGGESSRPGHAEVPLEEELRRVVPAIAAIRGALPSALISVDTIKPAVAEAALDAGADMLNDVWGVAHPNEIARVAAERRVPYVVMHNRERAYYRSVVGEVVADLQRALDAAVAAGCAWESLIVDPGIGFGKTAEQNLAVLHDLAQLRLLGRPILLGASRKSTIGKVLDVDAGNRLEGTLALTALAVAAGADIVRVHDVRENVRAARMADAVVRGGWHEADIGARAKAAAAT